MSIRAIPEGYHTVTPYLVLEGADRILQFVKDAFEARELHRMQDDSGRIVHAEVRIGDSTVMMADATEKWPAMPSLLHLYVEDCDRLYEAAISAGGTSVQPMTDQFYGDRSGAVRDAAGNIWSITTHVEDVPPDEMARRMQEWQAKQQR